MKITVLTLFPEMISYPLQFGVVGQAIEQGKIQIHTLNPRDFTEDKHNTVDDRPFGGGDGMVMKADVLARAVDNLNGLKVVLSPQGRRWSDQMARAIAKTPELVLICGRYAGFDQRFTERYADLEVSVGDFILSGGEIAALAIIDSVGRFIPGVLGNEQSPNLESFTDGLLECPQFTRPVEWDGWVVPRVLLSGDHAKIRRFRKSVSLMRTFRLRPDLLEGQDIDDKLGEAQEVLKECSKDELKSLGLLDEDRKTFSWD